MITAQEAKKMADNSINENIEKKLKEIYSDIEYYAKKSRYKTIVHLPDTAEKLRTAIKKELRSKGYKIPRISFFADLFYVKW